ncbi:MAG: hypothetical protein ABWZ82_01665 [Candidatus Limnocylindrales bacterium]
MGRRWRRGTLALGMMVSLTGVPAVASAQSEPPADPLVGSLLTAEDLPDGMQSQGIDEPPRFAIDDESFAAHDGRRAVGQVWTQGTLIVFDHRMELPDAEAAAAYLEAAEPLLSEAEASGLAPVMFTEPVGEDGRYYFGVQQVGDAEFQLHNFLFHVGPVAAKVFVAGGPELPADLPALVATAAAERIAAALEGAPSASASPGSSAGPSASPGATAGASPGASAGPEAALLAHVPEVIRGSCEAHDPTGTAIAEVACPTTDGIEASYALYANAIALDGDFNAVTAALPDERNATCGEGAFLGVFRIGGTDDGEVVGQLACWVDDDGATIAASDKRPMVLLILRDPDGDLMALTEHEELAPTP